MTEISWGMAKIYQAAANGPTGPLETWIIEVEGIRLFIKKILESEKILESDKFLIPENTS